LDDGYQIKTLVRNPEKLNEFKNSVDFIQGNIFEAYKIEETVRGTDVVLSTVGPPQRNPKNPEKYKRAMEDLSNFILNQINSKNWIKKAPLVASVK
jgi:putative NADH-flavin reductase